MSIIASLKNIDIQRHAVCVILDALEIDIDPEDGHLIFAADPSRPIDINGKILRLDVGSPISGTEYTVFNPFTREDHAQFLMTLTIHSQVFSDLLTPDEACAAEFHIESEKEMLDEDGNPTENGATTVTIADKDATSHGVGEHVDAAVATVLAILEYMLNAKMISDKKLEDLKTLVIEAYNEYTSLSEMKPSQRRNVITQKSELLRPPQAEDHSEGYFEDPNVVDPNDVVFEDDPDDDVDFTDEDFAETEEEEDEFVGEDFTNDELFDMMGIQPPVQQPQIIQQVSRITPIEEVNFFDEDFPTGQGVGMTFTNSGRSMPSGVVPANYPKTPAPRNTMLGEGLTPEDVSDGVFTEVMESRERDMSIESMYGKFLSPKRIKKLTDRQNAAEERNASFNGPMSNERSRKGMEDVNFFEP